MLLNYLYTTIIGIAFLFLISFGMTYWYVAFPLLVIMNVIKIFNQAQEKYVYDLRFWINLVDIIDACIIIAYIVSLALYFYSVKTHEICNMINGASFVIFVLNSSSKSSYLEGKSK